MAEVHTPLLQWLLAPESWNLPLEGFLEAFAARLQQAGVPVSRLTTSVRTMHPEVFVRAMRWRQETGVTISEIPHSVQQTPDYLGSPVQAIHQGGKTIHVSLKGDGPLPYPQLDSLRRQGATDYLIFPLHLGGVGISYISMTTDQPGGFPSGTQALMEAVTPALALRLEVDSARYATRSLLRVYLGHQAAERVLSGQFQRGTGEELEAAIFFCDMRGFSTFSDTAPMRQVVATLDQYFQALAGPIERHGGEILKFIGDAVLAIFPLEQDPAGACARSVAAAQEGIAAVQALGDQLAGAGGPRVRAGAAVHRGRVLYGNIGAQRRLDFTVIGPAVNEAARIESLCKELGEPVLISDEVAALVAPERLRPVGSHALRGIKASRTLFVPAPGP